MKSMMKKLIVAMITTASLLMGCSKKQANTVKPDPVNNFKFDFESGEYSFNFDSQAKSFYVRLYKEGEVDNSMPNAARRVRFRADEKNYEGTVDLSDLQAGQKYEAYVYTYVKDENSNLVYTMSKPVSGVYHVAYKTPKKNFALNQEGTTLTMNLSSKFFTEQYVDKEPNYEVTLYKNGVEVEKKTIMFSDIIVEEEKKQGNSGFGPGGPNANKGPKRTASISFTADDPTAVYTATIKVISTDDTAYYDSETSEQVPVTEPVVEEAPTKPFGGF